MASKNKPNNRDHRHDDRYYTKEEIVALLLTAGGGGMRTLTWDLSKTISGSPAEIETGERPTEWRKLIHDGTYLMWDLTIKPGAEGPDGGDLVVDLLIDNGEDDPISIFGGVEGAPSGSEAMIEDGETTGTGTVFEETVTAGNIIYPKVISANGATDALLTLIVLSEVS